MMLSEVLPVRLSPIEKKPDLRWEKDENKHKWQN